ncbi:hypothetical protein MPER_07372, partial [Moniliophthora perniciosa FA553]
KPLGLGEYRLVNPRYYVAYCGWLIIELVFVVTYVVETKGRTLEETAALFDGDQQQADLANMGGEAATMTMTVNRINGIQVTTEVHSSEDDINSLRSLQKREKDDGSIYEMSMVERNRASGSHTI